LGGGIGAGVEGLLEAVKRHGRRRWFPGEFLRWKGTGAEAAIWEAGRGVGRRRLLQTVKRRLDYWSWSKDFEILVIRS